MKDLYVQLRETLNRYAYGFPAVPDADIAYLKKIFTEDHARVFIAMKESFQLAEEVAMRLNQNPDVVKPILEEMAKKGLVMTTTKVAPTFYAPFPYLIGWGDWVAYYEDNEAALLDDEYRKGFFQQITTKGGPHPTQQIHFRTVPFYRTIPDTRSVASYDNVRKIIENAKSIAVSKCFCDLHRIHTGLEIAPGPLERCLLFGMYADYLIDKGFGRKISPEEAIEILDKCEEAGLIHNTSDLLKPVFICNCPKYCGSNIMRLQSPLPFAVTTKIHNYYAVVDTDICTGCEECVDCYVEAISIGSQGVAEINLEKCVGCGLCVKRCPVEALTLKEKPMSQHYIPVKKHPNVRSNDEYEADLEPYKDIIKPL